MDRKEVIASTMAHELDTPLAEEHPLKIQIASDLHIEQFDETPDPSDLITPAADVLILAGDVGSLYRYEQLQHFLYELCQGFKHVLYIPGNHEFYYVRNSHRLTMDALRARLYSLQRSIRNLYVLERKSVIINDVKIVGATLWSNPLIEVPRYIVRIHGIDTEMYREMHKEDLRFVEDSLNEEDDKRTLVVTHYTPSFDTLRDCHRKKVKHHSLYASNLERLLDGRAQTWVCGHVHSNFDYVTGGGTRVVGNQVGKTNDNLTDYRKDFVIEI
jgi:predicted phosphodiesterase